MERSKNRLWALSTVICLTLMIGCGKSDRQELINHLRRVVSSTATTIMVGESWSNHEAPDRYTQRTLESMSLELQEEVVEIESIASATAEEKELVKKTYLLVTSLSTFARQQDRTAVIQALDQLKVEQTALRSLTNSTPGE